MFPYCPCNPLTPLSAHNFWLRRASFANCQKKNRETALSDLAAKLLLNHRPQRIGLKFYQYVEITV